jgi:23S rRNA (adenine2030-N6)-methyltransferase
MFSYRHGFHAGNHADVLKHVVTIQLLKYLAQKDAPLLCIDTHAGAGLYQLDSEYALKNAEFESGIARLWDRKDLPGPVAEYVALVKALNPSGKMRHYPGSPFIAERTMREQDRLRLFELHTTESKNLVENFRKADAHAAAQGQRPSPRGKRVMIQRADGFTGLKALLPPPSRRGLVPDAAAAGVAPVAGQIEAPPRQRLARRHADRQRPVAGRLRSAQQRHVHHQSALDARGDAARGNALSGEGAWSR